MSLEFSIARTAQALETSVVDRNFDALMVKLREAEARLRALEASDDVPVVLTAAATEIVLPVANDPTRPWFTVWGRLVCTGVHVVSAKINGGTTNVKQIYTLSYNAGISSAEGQWAQGETTGTVFRIQGYLTPGAYRGFITESVGYTSSHPYTMTGGISYQDAATPITSLTIVNGTASGFDVATTLAYRQSEVP